MTQAIWITGATAALALLVVTLYLIYLNWNPQLGGTLLSVLLGGTVTLFIAVFSQLKESQVSSRFAVAIPFDTSTGFPQSGLEKLPRDESELPRFHWLSELYSIALQPHVPAPGGSALSVDLALKAKPTDADEMFAACGQLIQYKLLKDLRDNQSVSGAKPPVVDGHEIPSVQEPNLAAPVVDVPSAAVQQLLAPNRFHSAHAMLWQYRTLRLPPGAHIQLRHVPGSQTTGLAKDLIVIQRPNYFRGVITIEPLGATGPPLTTVRVAVSMRATFFKLTAGSSASADSKNWFEWLFRMLQEVNAPGA